MSSNSLGLLNRLDLLSGRSSLEHSRLGRIRFRLLGLASSDVRPDRSDEEASNERNDREEDAPADETGLGPRELGVVGVVGGDRGGGEVGALEVLGVDLLVVVGGV